MVDEDKDDETAKAYNIMHCGGDCLRFRLTATSGNDVVSHGEGVQHKKSAKVARSKLQ